MVSPLLVQDPTLNKEYENYKACFDLPTPLKFTFEFAPSDSSHVPIFELSFVINNFD